MIAYPSRMARVLLVTIGSLGDLHPFIAIGRSLIAQGHRVTLAVPEDGVAKVRAAGLNAEAILPGHAPLGQRLGLTSGELAKRVLADPRFVLDEILMPSLSASVAALDALAGDADVLGSSIFAFASDIVAEKRRLPLATILLQPMTLFSAWQPPTAPHFSAMRHHPRTGLGRGWNRIFYALVRMAMRRRYARRIDASRREQGLAISRRAPLLDHGAATQALLCCWSSTLGALPPDAPDKAELTGFPFFDSESGAEEGLAPDVAAFLRDGDPPLIFTLGSFAVASPGSFYDEALSASRALGRRAMMLTGQPGAPRRDGDCLFVNYAPHSAVFSRAAAIIHHGGVGTTGQALRAGRPQIVVPHFGDQFDNAARLQSAGLGRTIQHDRFKAAHAAGVISSALTSPRMADAARRAAAIITQEDGAAQAARSIIRLCR
ncbi:glycosyltransferase [Sphingomonadaceae bacterium jetA1]|jgi:UDP:flavonoid glycosyltransferase YjiC (YdhE family)|uniref:glycosyltransferase n=1 Tax=Facivitalis istanbulensis TaxID=3075838 RepID=UPI0034813C13